MGAIVATNGVKSLLRTFAGRDLPHCDGTLLLARSYLIRLDGSDLDFTGDFPCCSARAGAGQAALAQACRIAVGRREPDRLGPHVCCGDSSRRPADPTLR